MAENGRGYDTTPASGGPKGSKKWDENADGVPDVLSDPSELKRLLKKYGYEDSDLEIKAKRDLFYQAVRKEYSRKEAQKAYDEVYVADELDTDQLYAEFGYSLGVIKQFPELEELFRKIGDRIARGEWPTDAAAAQAEFNRLLSRTEFGKKTGTEIAADIQRYGIGKRDFAENIRKLKAEIQRQLTSMVGDATISDGDAEKLAFDLVYDERGFLSGAFDPQVIQRRLTDWITVKTPGADAPVDGGTQYDQGNLGGEMGTYQDQLQRWLANNGLVVSAERMSELLKQIQTGAKTVDQVKQDFRDNEMTRRYSGYADLFKGGIDVADIAMDFRQRMASLLEINMSDINLDDPYIQKALQYRTEDGKPQGMSLYDFERMVRKSPEWDKTTNAMSTYTDIGESILQSFGLRG